MKKSFSIFLLVLIILITLILLRLQSISFPRDISDATRIIYLEEFYDFGHLFKIFYQDHGFKLKPYIRNLRLNRERVNTPVEIHNHDILRVQDHGFLVKISPETHVYKEIFRRPINEVLPSAYTVKYIGGWTSGEKRDRMVSKTDMKLLRDLIIEISPDLLSRVIPSTIAFDGKLIALKRQNQSVQLICPHLDISRISKLQSQLVQKNHQIDIKSDDIIRIKSLDDGDDLVIKFNFKRVKSRIFRGSPGKERLVSSDITYMIISYLEKRRSPSDQTPVMVYLKSLDGQAVYRVSKNKETLFIGEKGLFIFDLMPDKLLDRQFIPDRIYEGGMMDIKELLDRRMVYRKNKNVYPVDLFFLKKLNNVFRDGLKKVEEYLKQNNIEWKSFIDETDFRNHVLKSEKIIQKMKRKRSWRRFCREIEKLNDPYFLKGVGIGINKNIDYTVFYRTGNMSWVPAENWTMDIPEVVGINAFYWGNLIKKSDGVEFKFQFKQRSSPFKFISVGDYAYSLDGKTYNKRNFFDGVQTVERMGRNRILFIRVSNLNRFNQDISEARLRVKINIQDSERQKRLLNSDESWESSIDLVNWNPVKIIPVKHYYGEKLEGALSIWYDEQWNPIFRGIKNRYFKKEFTLRFNPNQVSWTVRTPGEYLIWVNDRIIYAEKDFLKSLGIGKNTLILLVSKNGYLKKIPGSNLFVERENNIFLKQKQIRRAGFSKKNSHKRPDVVDVNRKKLAFDSEINGHHHRFFSSSAMGELESIIGSGKSESWGLEQVFSEIYEESQVEEIQLTINQDWHKIVVRNLKKKLNKNKDKEDMNPGYRNLKEQLKQAEKQLSLLRIGLIRRDNTRIQ
ncbi:MAG: hypothetical protein KAT17_07555, partial [Candidatus Aminicenantes bacterium]|nr:hypothetical protein [Candidatus Aminicenantes bacterium]